MLFCLAVLQDRIRRLNRCWVTAWSKQRGRQTQQQQYLPPSALPASPLRSPSLNSLEGRKRGGSKLLLLLLQTRCSKGGRGGDVRGCAAAAAQAKQPPLIDSQSKPSHF
jgi:hypothetical protein